MEPLILPIKVLIYFKKLITMYIGGVSNTGKIEIVEIFIC